ncbi:hypothetical protein MLD38_029577 [Melastoma candidum]|uniref:Uncharacterized protein n=1 Tax=Melastoma candidum TaxID=119954 RepID=A0ACB9N512_9MYRT|nr:hypothetical protein MLD38_029577 [Melastoma candidum]
MGWLSIKLLFTLVVVAASFMQRNPTARSLLAYDVAHVYLFNDIEYGPTLYAHCYSKDDDLGEQVLNWKESWDFSFGLDFFGGSEFYCRFKFNDESHLYPIYLQKRDQYNCFTCYWFITKNGPCRNPSNYTRNECHSWVGGVLG